MALQMKGKSNDPIRGLVDSLRTTINNHGDSLATAEQTGNLVTLESLSVPQSAMVMNHYTEVTQLLKNTLHEAFGSLGLEAFDESTPEGASRLENALAAGALAAMAVGNPSRYAEQATKSTVQQEQGVNIVEPIMMGAGGRMDYRLQPSMESFDDRELRETLPYSIAFNIFASRQDEFSEMFYPTTVVTPDQAGIDVNVSRFLVFNEVRRAIDGKAADFGKKNLLDAAVDSSILGDETTRLVPVVLADNSNLDKFVNPVTVAPSFVKLAGQSIPTAPLAMGNTVDLIGISDFAPLIGSGVLDHTDSIDARILLDAIYLDVKGATPGPGIKFNTSRLPRNTFNKTVERNFREMNLQFTSRDIVIDKDTRAVDGSVIPELAAVAAGDYTVRLEVSVNGEANVEFGNVKVFTAPVRVATIHDVNGTEISLTAGAGASIKATLEATALVGYDLHVNRTNANRRTRGLLLDTTWETDRYTIPLASPISAPAPTSSNRDAADLKALITAARIRNSNNAVTALLNYADTLKAFVRGPRRKNVVPEVQGMGRFLVEPFFEEHTLDLVQAINTIKSHEKATDIQQVLVNAVRDVAYRMYRDGRYQAALDAVSGGSGEIPTLAVGTDQVLIRHLIVDGDNRTFGTMFDKFLLKSTLDERMANKIVLSFVRNNTDGPDPLTFGTHAWIPELTSSIQVTRNGAVVKESMVQPRTLHFNNLPMMAVINVVGLSEVLSDKIAQGELATDLTNPWLDGITP